MQQVPRQGDRQRAPGQAGALRAKVPGRYAWATAPAGSAQTGVALSKRGA